MKLPSVPLESLNLPRGKDAVAPWLECEDMTTPIKNETKRGYKEASKQFELLRTKWPLAFPRAPDKVRPLASGGASILAEAFGWSHAYAGAVLMVWKLRDTYWPRPNICVTRGQLETWRKLRTLSARCLNERLRNGVAEV